MPMPTEPIGSVPRLQDLINGIQEFNAGPRRLRVPRASAGIRTAPARRWRVREPSRSLLHRR